MDFFTIKTRRVKDRETKDEYIEIYPSFIVDRCQDLMVRGRAFYAIWDEAKKLWSTDEYDVPRLVDQALWNYRDEKFPKESTETPVRVSTLRDADTERWAKFKRYVYNLSDNDRPLDSKVIFNDHAVERSDYASFKLDYARTKGSHDAWDRIIGTLYSEEERTKIEWAMGAIFNGDARYIQKFIVLYGEPGTGKGTIMGLLEDLYGDYVATFDAKALGSSNSQFATSVFASNPLVAIQQDGDLSKLNDNTVINTIVSHENIIINEKNKPTYSTKINAFLFMGTNTPVKISDSKSGLIRRLIQVSPTGNKIPGPEYQELMNRVQFEYGAIANHCLDIYEELGFHYYDNYRPTQMMYQTDDILSFFTDNYDVFASQEYTTMKQAYTLYLQFCEEYGITRPVARKTLMQEMYTYFDEYHDRLQVGDTRVRSCFVGFRLDNVFETDTQPVKSETWVDLKEQESIFDIVGSDSLAQYANEDGTPRQKWVNVETHLSDLNTKELHFVKVDPNHIVIDFDLKDDDGNKSIDRNIKAASAFPPTYAEVSKSGGGLHLHYIWDGDVSLLDNVYHEGIEIKVYSGGSSLRRKLSLCTSNDITTISSGLPLKEVKDSDMFDEKAVRSEKSLRNLIDRNLRKEIHPGTKPSVEFIKKILDDAYASGLAYDVTDMRAVISIFASRSTNHAASLLAMVNQMKFKGEEKVVEAQPETDQTIIFFDVEVYPNLFLVGWKFKDRPGFIPMINPAPHEIEELFKHKLVGFNNRQYDNHMLYARYMGYSTEDLFNLSKKIINDGDQNAKFGEAYGLSHADIYDISTKKQSLKKWEIELGIPHMEMSIPWDEPVPDNLIDTVVKYNKNDVLATEAVWNANISDVHAREMLSGLSGLPINDPTRKHVERILFGNDRNHKSEFRYTNLATGEVE